jgi:hypothetical protein
MIRARDKSGSSGTMAGTMDRMPYCSESRPHPALPHTSSPQVPRNAGAVGRYTAGHLPRAGMPGIHSDAHEPDQARRPAGPRSWPPPSLVSGIASSELAPKMPGTGVNCRYRPPIFYSHRPFGQIPSQYLRHFTGHWSLVIGHWGLCGVCCQGGEGSEPHPHSPLPTPNSQLPMTNDQ